MNHILGKGIALVLVVYAVFLKGLSSRDLQKMFWTKYLVVLSLLLHSMVIFTIIMIITFMC